MSTIKKIEINNKLYYLDLDENNVILITAEDIDSICSAEIQKINQNNT